MGASLAHAGFVPAATQSLVFPADKPPSAGNKRNARRRRREENNSTCKRLLVLTWLAPHLGFPAGA